MLSTKNLFLWRQLPREVLCDKPSQISEEMGMQGEDREEQGGKDSHCFTFFFGASCNQSLHIKSTQIHCESIKSCFKY